MIGGVDVPRRRPAVAVAMAGAADPGRSDVGTENGNGHMKAAFRIVLGRSAWSDGWEGAAQTERGDAASRVREETRRSKRRSMRGGG